MGACHSAAGRVRHVPTHSNVNINYYAVVCLNGTIKICKRLTSQPPHIFWTGSPVEQVFWDRNALPAPALRELDTTRQVEFHDTHIAIQLDQSNNLLSGKVRHAWRLPSLCKTAIAWSFFPPGKHQTTQDLHRRSSYFECNAFTPA